MDNLIQNNNNEKINLIVFEFFSGIGGMHDALRNINIIQIQKFFLLI